MTLATAPQLPCKTAGETRNVAVSFQGKLDAGESLTGTPTVTEVTTSDLTITSPAVSTVALTINKKSVPAGEAVQFNVAGGTAGTEYTIKVSVGTDATPTQTLVVLLRLKVVAD